MERNPAAARRHGGLSRIRVGMLSLLSGLGMLSTAPLVVADETTGLIGHWTFEEGTERDDLTGNWGPLELRGNASIAQGRLDINGASSPDRPTGWAYARGWTKGTIANKTLISWFSLDSLNARSGTVLGIDNINGDNFDSIVFAERQRWQWMAGSSGHRRTQDFGAAANDATLRTLRQIAISYEQLAGNQVRITMCRDGSQVGQYVSNNFTTWSSGNAEILFGPRHTIDGLNPTNLPGGVDAHIKEARIYNRAVPCGELAHFGQPAPNPTSVRFTGNQTILQGAYYGAQATTFADINGDKYDDFVVVNNDTTVVKYNNKSGGFGVHTLLYEGEYKGTQATTFADIDGDGFDDFVVVNNDATVVKYNNGSGGFGQHTLLYRGAYYGSRATTFADINGDGFDDFIVVNSDATVVKYNNKSGGFGAHTLLHHGAYSGTKATTFADLNGDGFDDFIAVDTDNSWVMVNNRSGAFGPREEPLLGRYYGSRATTFANINGDGFADFVVVNESSTTTRNVIPAGLPAGAIVCANEGQTCHFDGTAEVRYGANGQWRMQSHTNSVMCSNQVFGDPVPRVPKKCFVSNVVPATVASSIEPVYLRANCTHPHCGAAQTHCSYLHSNSPQGGAPSWGGEQLEYSWVIEYSGGSHAGDQLVYLRANCRGRDCPGTDGRYLQSNCPPGQNCYTSWGSAKDRNYAWLLEYNEDPKAGNQVVNLRAHCKGSHCSGDGMYLSSLGTNTLQWRHEKDPTYGWWLERPDTRAPANYQIGQQGPGGGIVLQLDDAGGTSGVEIAPVDSPSKLYWDDADDYASSYTLNTGNSTTGDWYLPNKEELLGMCEGLFKNGVGGLKEAQQYWGSTPIPGSDCLSPSCYGSFNISQQMMCDPVNYGKDCRTNCENLFNHNYQLNGGEGEGHRFWVRPARKFPKMCRPEVVEF